MVTDAWSAAEYPERVGDLGCMPAYLWVQLFTEGGYTNDGESAAPPTEPVTLYRGAVPKRWFGISWTSNLELAQRFASTMNGRLPGHVYVFQAPPDALLAFIGKRIGRDESEYVINPDYLSKATVKRFNQKRPK